jgi:hypothetical protein
MYFFLAYRERIKVKQRGGERGVETEKANR